MPQLPSGPQRAAHAVIPFPEPYRFPQTMTSLRRRRPDYSWGDFPGSKAGPGGEMEELSRVLKGAGARARRAAPPVGGGGPAGPGAGRGGPGRSRAGPAASRALIGCWRVHVTQAGALLRPQWNWSRGGAENADLASSTDIHSLFLSDTHSSPHSHLCQRA